MKEPSGKIASPSVSNNPPPRGRTTFMEVIEKNRAPLIRVAYRTTGNIEEAEDIVQEAIMKAYLCLHQFRGESRVETWLRAIVVNTARNWVRRRRGYTRVPMESGPAGDPESVLREVADSRKNPEQWFEYNEMEARIMAAVEELSSRYQAVIRMCVLGESSYLEASSALNLNPVTVKARVFRGREMLKRALRRGSPERTAPPSEALGN